MKKLFAVLVFLAALVPVFAADYNVCIFPQNDQLKTMISENFITVINEDNTESEVKVVNASEKYREELVSTFDTNYLNMICDRDDISLLIIPYNTTLYAYSRQNEMLAILYRCKEGETEYPVSVLSRLLPYFATASTEIADFQEEITEDFSEEEKAKVDSFAEIKFNQEEIYRKAKNNFYKSLSNTLILVGADAAVKSFVSTESKGYKATDIVFKSLILASAADNVFRLIQYYKSGQKIVP